MNPGLDAMDDAKERGSSGGTLQRRRWKKTGVLCSIDPCKSCHNCRCGENNEPMMNRRQWWRLVGEKRPQGKLAVGLGLLGLDQNKMELYEELNSWIMGGSYKESC